MHIKIVPTTGIPGMTYGQKIRVFLFYISVFTFLVGLPFILSYALGYKFAPRTFRFIKTGLLVLKTQPQAAEVYLNGELQGEKTPVTINELLPGKYSVLLKLEKHYPWSADVYVEAGKVARFEKIILFPLRPHIKHLSKERLSHFCVDKEKDAVYYFDQETGYVYKSDLEGHNFEKAAEFIKLVPPPTEYRLSLDRKKILYFNSHQFGISYIRSQKENSSRDAPFVLNLSNQDILDVFWHSDSYHLILVTSKTIEVKEARPDSVSAILVDLNKQDPRAFYDFDTDTLYFLDSQRAADGNIYDNLYKLELNQEISNLNLEELIKRRINERDRQN